MSKIRQLKAEAKVALPNTGETYVADDGTVSMVLADEHNDDYEPTDDEIKEYGEWLGMSFPQDDELTWLAREGLKAPLPKEWKPCKTDTGDVYYFNFKTGDSIWDHPLDEYFKSKLKTEREKLEKKKSGIEVDGALAKLKQRTVFDTPNEVGGLAKSTSGVPLKSISSAASSLNNSVSSSTPVNNNATVSKLASSTTSAKTAAAASKAIPVPIPASVEEVPLDAISDYKPTTGTKAKATAAAAAALSLESTPAKQQPSASSLSALSTPVNNKAGGLNALSSAATASAKPIAATLLASPVSATSLGKASSIGGFDDGSLASPRVGALGGGGIGIGAPLVSEAEKNMEAKIKAELETEHAAKVKAMEAALRDELARARRRHDAAVDTLKDSHQQTVKRAVKEATDAMEDELSDKRRALDQQYKREVEKLQDDVDDARSELRRLKASAGGSGGGASEAQLMEAEQQARDALNAKVKAIKEEIEEIRDRHAKSKRDSVEEARARTERDLEGIASTAKAAAKANYEQRMAGLKAQHDATCAKLKAATEEEIEEERARAARAGKGQEQALIEELGDKQSAEVRKIEANGREELATLEEAHAAQVRDLKATMREELAQRGAAAGAASGADADAIAAVEDGKRARIAQLRAEHDASLASERAARMHLREQRIAEASAAGGGAASEDPEAAIASAKATIAADTAASIRAMESAHAEAVRSLQDRLAALQAANAASSSSAAEAAVHAASELKLKAFVAETSAKRDAEQREWQLQKDDILRQIQTQEAASKAAAAAAQSASVGPAKHAALLQAQQEADAYVSEQSRLARLRSAEQRQLLASIATDTSEAELKHKMVAAEAELRAEAAVKKQEITARMMAAASAAAAEGGGLTDVEDPADSDDEAAVRATMMVAPLPDVDVEVRRRVAALTAAFEAKEAALRATFRATAGPSGNVAMVPPPSHQPLSRSTTPTGSQFQPPTIVGMAPHGSGGGGPRASISSTDPILQRVSREQQEANARQQAVAEARRQWESEMLASNGGQFQQMVAPPQHQQHQPAAGGHVDPNLVAVLMTLSSKLDTMNRRIDAIQQSSPPRQPRESTRYDRAAHRSSGDANPSSGRHKSSSGASPMRHHSSSARVASPSRQQRTTSAHKKVSSSAHKHRGGEGSNPNPIKDTLQKYLSGGI